MTTPWIAPDLRPILDRLSDVQVFALTLYGEARSEPIEGIVGVGWAIRNRVDADLHDDGIPDWWGEGYRGVCLAPGQFSCWNPAGGTGNHAKVVEMAQRIASGEKDGLKIEECAWAALGIYKGALKDRTKGCTHYHVATMHPRPKWAQGIIPRVQIARHVFYANVP